MRPTSFSFGSAEIPFRAAFEHAAASRKQSATVIVHVADADGHVGLGEGCPRPYVTGETVESAMGFLQRRQHTLAALSNPDELAGWISRNSREIDENPSAFCAAELALLDLFARQADQSIEKMFFAPELAGPVTATAVYGSGSYMKFRMQAGQYARNGMAEAKLKLSGKARRDGWRAAFLARRGKVRLDANNLWPDADKAVAGLKHAVKQAWAVEEPVARGDWAAMQSVAERTGLSIIVDESFLKQSDIDAMPAGFIPNFRVSKLGGLMRSVSALRLALEQGRKVIVGAQVGETSILARVGLVLAAGAGDALVGFEGAYGTNLLRQDVVEPSVEFGEGGKVRPGPVLAKPGLGLSLRADAKAYMKPPISTDYWSPLATAPA